MYIEEETRKVTNMNPYAANAAKNEGMVRVVTHLADELVSAIDDWGVPAGCKSRSDAIRKLINKGLEQEASARATA